MRVRMKKDEVLKWLIEKSSNGVLKNPINRAAEKDGLYGKGKSVKRFLNVLKKEGLIDIVFCSHNTNQAGRPRKEIERIELKYSLAGIPVKTINKVIMRRSASEKPEKVKTIPVATQPLKVKDIVVVLFDYDNTFFTAPQKGMPEISVPHMYDAVIRYAKKLGNILKKEAFITTRTDERDFVVNNFFSLDKTPVVIVPPQENAADEKMVESIRFSLMIPRIKAFVIVSDDNKAFGAKKKRTEDGKEISVCGEIKEAGCEVHVVTTGFVSPELAREATRVVSLSDLMRVVSGDSEPKGNNKFDHAANRINHGITPSTDEEKFVAAFLDGARCLTGKPGQRLNFNRMKESVWIRMDRSIRKSFSLEDCRCVMESLIMIGMIKKETFCYKLKDFTGYFVR